MFYFCRVDSCYIYDSLTNWSFGGAAYRTAAGALWRMLPSACLFYRSLRPSPSPPHPLLRSQHRWGPRGARWSHISPSRKRWSAGWRLKGNPTPPAPAPSPFRFLCTSQPGRWLHLLDLTQPHSRCRLQLLSSLWCRTRPRRGDSARRGQWGTLPLPGLFLSERGFVRWFVPSFVEQWNSGSSLWLPAVPAVALWSCFPGVTQRAQQLPSFISTLILCHNLLVTSSKSIKSWIHYSIFASSAAYLQQKKKKHTKHFFFSCKNEKLGLTTHLTEHVVYRVLPVSKTVFTVCLHYLQYVVELGLELKVRFGFHDHSFKGLLQHLNSSLSLLTGMGDSHVLPLAAESLLLGFVHLWQTRRSRVLTHTHTHTSTHSQCFNEYNACKSLHWLIDSSDVCNILNSETAPCHLSHKLLMLKGSSFILRIKSVYRS